MSSETNYKAPREISGDEKPEEGHQRQLNFLYDRIEKLKNGIAWYCHAYKINGDISIEGVLHAERVLKADDELAK